MYRNHKRIAYIIFTLAAIGFIVQFARRPLDLLIPAIVFGVVFLLYKFPPKRRNGRRSFFNHPRFKPPGPAKRARFRVIRGRKNSGNDDPPRYH